MGVPPALIDDGSDAGSWAEALAYPNSITIIGSEALGSLINAAAPTGETPRNPASPVGQFIEAPSPGGSHTGGGAVPGAPVFSDNTDGAVQHAAPITGEP